MSAVVPYERIVEEDLNVGPRATVAVSMPGGGSQNAHQIALSSLATPAGGHSETWDPGPINSGAVASVNVTIAGAALGDMAIASLSTLQSGCILHAFVSAANTIRVTLANLSGAPVDTPSGTLTVLLFELV